MPSGGTGPSSEVQVEQRHTFLNWSSGYTVNGVLQISATYLHIRFAANLKKIFRSETTKQERKTKSCSCCKPPKIDANRTTKNVLLETFNLGGKNIHLMSNAIASVRHPTLLGENKVLKNVNLRDPILPVDASKSHNFMKTARPGT